MCQQWKTGPYNETKCAECPFTVIPGIIVISDMVDIQFPVKELPVLNVSETETWSECQFVDPAGKILTYTVDFYLIHLDDCTFKFLYYYDGAGNLTVWVKEEKG